MIEKRVLQSGRVSWRVRWYGPDRKERSKSFATRRDAKQFESERQASRNTWVSPQTGSVRLSTVWETFKTSQTHLKASTLDDYESAWRTHIDPKFGNWPIGKIRFGDIAAWVGAMNLTSGPGTTRKAFRVLSRTLGWGVEAGLVSRNEAIGVKLPRQARHDARVANAEQILALSNAVRPKARDLVLLLAFTGMRWGESAALRVEDVDIDRRRLRVRRTTYDVNGHIFVGSPKSHQHRNVPIAEVLVPILARRIEGRSRQELVFPSANGSPWRNGNFRRDSDWYAATKSVDLEGFRIHDLRHTAASLMIQSGATVVDVAAVLGHASSHTTLTIYAHLIGSRLDDVSSKLNTALADSYGQNAATEATTS